MPVNISGTTLGQSTKDATALPEDVRSGKIFYGSSGKAIGVWEPKVTDYTIDATALPEDVKKGNIFYNNQGRQVGTFDLPFSIKTMMITGSGNSKTMKSSNVLEYNLRDGLSGRVQGIPHTYNSAAELYYGKELKGIWNIYAVKINGEIFKAPSCGYCTKYIWNQDSTQAGISFHHYYDTLYVGIFIKVSECIIYYE